MGVRGQVASVSETRIATTDADEPAAGSPAADAARRPGAGADAAAEFELLYRAQVDAITAYFARRSPDPQTVAD